MLQDEIGAKVRRLREAKGLSQEQLAVYSGLSVATVDSIERGIRNPTIETLQAIAETLDIAASELFI